MSGRVGNPKDRPVFPQQCSDYRKVPKFSDTRQPYCNSPIIQTKRQNLEVFCQKHANGIANSEEPDQTASLGQSDLGLHCLPRQKI